MGIEVAFGLGWEVEIDFFSVQGSELTWVLCGGVENVFFIMSGSKLPCFLWRGAQKLTRFWKIIVIDYFGVEVEIYVVLCGGSKLTLLYCRHRNVLGFCTGGGN